MSALRQWHKAAESVSVQTLVYTPFVRLAHCHRTTCWRRARAGADKPFIVWSIIRVKLTESIRDMSGSGANKASLAAIKPCQGYWRVVQRDRAAPLPSSCSLKHKRCMHVTGNPQYWVVCVCSRISAVPAGWTWFIVSTSNYIKLKNPQQGREVPRYLSPPLFTVGIP